MTIDQLAAAAGVVERVIVLDKLGRDYIAWLKAGDETVSMTSPVDRYTGPSLEEHAST